jgi:dTDP-4-amino-4,6-dideoxygalactose transaminase
MNKPQLKIPLFDLDIGEEELQAVENILYSKWLTMGETTIRFEEAFAHYLGVPYCFAVCNGTAALHLAVRALGIEANDEVICPSLTFVATANAILYSGAIPVFADIQGKDDFNISPASIEKNINKRTKAILVVHYGGYSCDMKAILDIASRHKLKIIEDAAHAPGAEYYWRDRKDRVSATQKVGTIGDIGCFSFFSNKNLSTGEGGMVVTKSENLAERVKVIRSHGMTSLTLDRHLGHSYSYDVVELGYNYRIDEMRSALGIAQLGKLSEKNERRKALDALYRHELQKVEGLEIPFDGFPHPSSYHIFPILLPERINRLAFMEALRAEGIQTSIHYPPIHKFSYYQQKFGGREEDLKWTEYVGSHEVTIPLYPSLGVKYIKYIVSRIGEILKYKK